MEIYFLTIVISICIQQTTGQYTVVYRNPGRAAYELTNGQAYYASILSTAATASEACNATVEGGYPVLFNDIGEWLFTQALANENTAAALVYFWVGGSSNVTLFAEIQNFELDYFADGTGTYLVVVTNFIFPEPHFSPGNFILRTTSADLTLVGVSLCEIEQERRIRRRDEPETDILMDDNTDTCVTQVARGEQLTYDIYRRFQSHEDIIVNVTFQSSIGTCNDLGYIFGSQDEKLAETSECFKAKRCTIESEYILSSSQIICNVKCICSSRNCVFVIFRLAVVEADMCEIDATY